MTSLKCLTKIQRLFDHHRDHHDPLLKQLLPRILERDKAEARRLKRKQNLERRKAEEVSEEGVEDEDEVEVEAMHQEVEETMKTALGEMQELEGGELPISSFNDKKTPLFRESVRKSPFKAFTNSSFKFILTRQVFFRNENNCCSCDGVRHTGVWIPNSVFACPAASKGMPSVFCNLLLG